MSNLQSMTPDQWQEHFNVLPSYTYNNNYLFVDYNAVDEVKRAASTYDERVAYIQRNNVSILTTLEVVPSKSLFWDATGALIEQRIYISINTPVNETLFELSGYADMNDPYWSYNESSRHCIAFRDLPKVDSFEDFKAYARYNDYKNDPCSNGDPG